MYTTTHLFAVPRQGGDPVRLNPEGTNGYCNAPPCFRSVGDASLFMTFDVAFTGNQLYDVDLSSPSPSARWLTSFAGGTLIDFVAVAPDPSRVLLLAKDTAGNRGIHLVDRSVASPSSTRLFQATADAYSPHSMGFAPDSRRFHLIADLDVDGYSDLFIATIQGGTAALSDPLTPQDLKLTGVGVAWRPLPLP